MRIDIVTLFPGMVEPVLGASMLGRARARGLVDIRVVNLRDYAEGKHRITDDYQFGGGGGMVLKPGPLFAAAEALSTPGSRVILMDPRGRRLTQTVAAGLARETHLILLAGRYEGVDARVPSPRLRMTMPSNICVRSFSPSTTLTCTRTVSPGANPSRSFLSCPASTNRIASIALTRRGASPPFRNLPPGSIAPTYLGSPDGGAGPATSCGSHCHTPS